MNDVKDGGPAFPTKDKYVDEEARWVPRTGMTLRDWFAAQALAGALGPNSDLDAINEIVADIARNAYAIADAMLAERAKVKP